MFQRRLAATGRARTLIAFAFHWPGLWLLCGETLPPKLRARNLAAVIATAGAMGASAACAPPGYRLLAAAVAWAPCHALWGIYLASALR
jgi:hypothetical protein